MGILGAYDCWNWIFCLLVVLPLGEGCPTYGVEGNGRKRQAASSLFRVLRCFLLEYSRLLHCLQRKDGAIGPRVPIYCKVAHVQRDLNRTYVSLDYELK